MHTLLPVDTVNLIQTLKAVSEMKPELDQLIQSMDARCSEFDRQFVLPRASGIRNVAWVDARWVCDVISVVAEFMVDVAGVDAERVIQ
jgi:hypothetical protein